MDTNVRDEGFSFYFTRGGSGATTRISRITVQAVPIDIPWAEVEAKVNFYANTEHRHDVDAPAAYSIAWDALCAWRQ